jgi:leucyl-tRNA synthetase
VPVPDEQLPVVLPENVEITGAGSPLAKMPEFYECKCPKCGGDARRETDTMDTFFESSWYFLRYACPDNDHGDGRRARRLLVQGRYRPVHRRHRARHPAPAVLALLHQADARCRPDRRFGEPFANLLTQGMVVAPTFYRDLEGGKKQWINPADVDVVTDERGRPTGATLKADGQPVVIGGTEKMSKSKNNGVDPQSLIDQYGADTARLFIMFASPPDQSLEWSDAGVEGAYRFLRRLWKTTFDHVSGRPRQRLSEQKSLSTAQADLRRKLHQTIGQGRRRLRPPQAVQHRDCRRDGTAQRLRQDCDLTPTGRALAQETLESIALLLFPIVPHIGQALFAELKPGPDAGTQPSRKPTRPRLKQDEIELMVQVNGKLRGAIRVSPKPTRRASKPPRWPPEGAEVHGRQAGEESRRRARPSGQYRRLRKPPCASRSAHLLAA